MDQPQPGVFVPALATRWETDDFQTWRFYLRDDVSWHNGDHFTADCVRFTVENALANPGTLAFNRYRNVETVNVINDYTVELILNEPNVDILFEFANHGGASILNRRAFEENPEDPMWASIGTGPFQVADFTTADFMRLERFDGFWGEAPPTQSMTLWSIPEEATRAVMLESGEVQVSFGLSAEALDRFGAMADFQLFSAMNVSPTSFSFNNMGDEVVMCPYFRRAVAHALIPEDVAFASWGNWAVAPWDGNLWGAGVQYRLEGLPRREHDPDLARSYLERSVYDGRSLELAVVPASGVAPQVVQMQLAAVGINVHIETMDIPSFVDMHTLNPESERELHLFPVAANPSALRTLRTGFYPGAATNRLNYINPVVTELTDLISSTNDEAIRRDAAYQIQRILYDDIPAIAVFFQLTGVATVNGIGGIAMGNDPFATCFRDVFWDLNLAPEGLRP